MTKPSEILPVSPAYDLRTHLAYVQDLHRRYPLNSEQKCEDATFDLLQRLRRRPWMLIVAMEQMTATLLEQNAIYQPFTPTLESASFLRRAQKELTASHRIQSAQDALVSFLEDLCAELPSTAFIDPNDMDDWIAVPLIDFVDPMRFLQLVLRFQDVTYERGEYTFDDLRFRIRDNVVRASGYDPDTYDGTRPLKNLFENNEPKEILLKYVTDTPFLELLADTIPFAIPQHIRFEHTGSLWRLRRRQDADAATSHPSGSAGARSAGDGHHRQPEPDVEKVGAAGAVCRQAQGPARHHRSRRRGRAGSEHVPAADRATLPVLDDQS